MTYGILIGIVIGATLVLLLLEAYVKGKRADQLDKLIEAHPELFDTKPL